MKRVMVIGGPGSGKSTLAKRLHAITGLPLYHLDRLFWRPGWQPSPKDEWRQLNADIAAREEWIVDGCYSDSFDLRMPRADLILWLDLPRRITLPRVLKRTMLNFGREREDLGPGCPDRLDFAFLKWAWTFRPAHAARFRLALAQYAPHANVTIFAGAREADRFLGELSC
jgi:adenylate kinase family enzyme